MERPAGGPTSPPPPKVIKWWNPPPEKPQSDRDLKNHKRNIRGLLLWLRQEQKISEERGCDAAMIGDMQQESYFSGRQDMAFRAEMWIESYTRGIE